MKYILIWVATFITVYLFYLLFVILRKEKLKQFKNNSYLNYLVKKYKLDIKKLNIKNMAHIIALANAFIISTTCSVVFIIDKFLLQLALAFGVLIILQIVVYHIIGISLKRRG